MIEDGRALHGFLRKQQLTLLLCILGTHVLHCSSPYLTSDQLMITWLILRGSGVVPLSNTSPPTGLPNAASAQDLLHLEEERDIQYSVSLQ